MVEHVLPLESNRVYNYSGNAAIRLVFVNASGIMDWDKSKVELYLLKMTRTYYEPGTPEFSDALKLNETLTKNNATSGEL